jgi:hypothetical protein
MDGLPEFHRRLEEGKTLDRLAGCRSHCGRFRAVACGVAIASLSHVRTWT